MPKVIYWCNFSLLGILHADFKSGYTNLQSHQQRIHVPFCSQASICVSCFDDLPFWMGQRNLKDVCSLDLVPTLYLGCSFKNLNFSVHRNHVCEYTYIIYVYILSFKKYFNNSISKPLKQKRLALCACLCGVCEL